MFVTDSFVYIHLPKTGGTFVAETLARIHAERGDRVDTLWFDPANPVALPVVEAGHALRLMLTTRQQHGTRSDIPEPYADRPVVATMRHPCERYVSQYVFGWWHRQPDRFGPVEWVRATYPRYPDLTFDDFVHLANNAALPFPEGGAPEVAIGLHTQQCVQHFFRDPDRAFSTLLRTASAATLAREALADVHILRQQHLNDDLADWLTRWDYRRADIEAVRAAQRIWPPEGGRPADEPWEPYYTPDLLAFVRHRERLLFEWFPDFDR